MNLIVDCSFIMCNILPDENKKKIEEIFDQIARNEFQVCVPSIFYLECNNYLCEKTNTDRGPGVVQRVHYFQTRNKSSG